MLRITKSFSFEMAHALSGYDGACKNLHGHSFRLEVTLHGAPLQQPGHPKDGMVLDFKDLKEIVLEHFLNHFDHALVLHSATPPTVKAALTEHFEKVVLLPFQPTCENLTGLIVEKISRHLPDRVELYSVKLYETATAWVEWCAEDGPPFAMKY